MKAIPARFHNHQQTVATSTLEIRTQDRITEAGSAMTTEGAHHGRLLLDEADRVTETAIAKTIDLPATVAVGATAAVLDEVVPILAKRAGKS